MLTSLQLEHEIQSLQNWHARAEFEAIHDGLRLHFQRANLRTDYVNRKALREAFEALEYAKALGGIQLRLATPEEDHQGFDFEVMFPGEVVSRVQTTLVDEQGRINGRMAMLDSSTDDREFLPFSGPFFEPATVLRLLIERAELKVTKLRARRTRDSLGMCSMHLLLHLNMKVLMINRIKLQSRMAATVSVALSEFKSVAVLHYNMASQDMALGHEGHVVLTGYQSGVYPLSPSMPLGQVETWLDKCFPKHSDGD